MNMSNWLEEALLNATLRNIPFTSVATLYGSLHSAVGATESTAAWTATEFTSGVELNYSRLAIASSVWTDPSGVSFSETNTDLLWPTAGSAWGNVTHVGLWDASTSGNLWYWFALPALRTVGNGDVFRLISGNMSVEMQ